MTSGWGVVFWMRAVMSLRRPAAAGGNALPFRRVIRRRIVTGEEQLAAEFEAHRPYLHAIAFRTLGSHADADDAVQEAWLRLAPGSIPRRRPCSRTPSASRCTWSWTPLPRPSGCRLSCMT